MLANTPHDKGFLFTLENAIITEGQRLIIRLYRECKAYEKSLVNSTTFENDSEVNCPVVFDGYLCWGPAKANTTEIKSCPNYVIGYDGNLKASKICTENGTWWRHPESGGEWSNYTSCIDQNYFHSRQLINDIYFYGYCFSLVTLIISLVIFLSFRSLRCTRIRIHTQLFISLALSCIMWILWYNFVVDSTSVIANNPSWCISLHIMTQYLMICNYFWMFCEGIHLHLALVVVFIKDDKAIKMFMVIGWIVPLIFVTIYSILRARSDLDSKLCWVEESHFMWILLIPVIVVLVCSAAFLVNIVRVLITKLHPKSNNPAPLAIKKAVRATLILIPLFGLQHILLPFRPIKDSIFEFPYQILSAILISLQGFCVSFLFCFVNHEVVTQIVTYLHHLCPGLFTTYRERYYAPPPTTTRDIVV
ncbi:CLUMA_CG018241, isoform A [Clunio marinus]|uniref:CLUMA_CG018241, isoform A n=1 Tax=Clunio marinus TaxID=568069 RepID=A0A1J1J1H9_9DIPT|nr:CLUMA_CG018241, isoform A [Clunio marinus]